VGGKPGKKKRSKKRGRENPGNDRDEFEGSTWVQQGPVWKMKGSDWRKRLWSFGAWGGGAQSVSSQGLNETNTRRREEFKVLDADDMENMGKDKNSQRLGEGCCVFGVVQKGKGKKRKLPNNSQRSKEPETKGRPTTTRGGKGRGHPGRGAWEENIMGKGTSKKPTNRVKYSPRVLGKNIPGTVRIGAGYISFQKKSQ